MNVNTTSSVTSGKSAELLKASADTSTEKSEGSSEGFLDKLLSLMFGGKEAVADGKNALTDVKDETSDNADETTDSVGKDSASLLGKALQGKGVKDLSAAELEALTELSEEQLGVLAKQQGVPLDQFKLQVKTAQMSEASQSNTSVTQDPETIKSQSAQWMNAGQQLLGKLHQANQTLAKTTANELDGKALPQSSALSQSLSVQASEVNSEEKALSNKELLELKRWHDLSKPDAQAEVDAVIASSPITEQEMAQLMAVKQQHPELSQDQLKALLAAQRELQQEAQDAVPTVASAAPVSVAAAATVAAQEAASSPSSGIADATMTDKQRLHLLQEMAAMKAGQTVQNQTSAQQPNPQGANGHTSALMTDKAFAAQQVAANADSAAQPLIAANPMAAAAAASDKGLTEAVLKSALGANALAGLGKGKSVSPNTGAESSLAHQLASAAGQSVNGANGLVRAEATTATHDAVQLTKDGNAADQLADRVQMMMSKNLKQIDIRLDPPELGRMHIKMQMHADGGASVHFTVASQHARDALEQSIPRLREMLSQQGVQLGGTSVQHQGAGQQQGYAAAGGQSGQSGSGSSLNHQENLEADVKLDLNVASKRDGISYYA